MSDIRAGETTLNSDALVIKALGRELVAKGNVQKLLDENSLKFAGDLDDPKLLTQLGLDPKASIKIEDHAIMGFIVVRIRVSKSYELWIQGYGRGRKDSAFKASVMPYSEKRFGYKLTHHQDWASTEYP